jgi:hypothetical protein
MRNLARLAFKKFPSRERTQFGKRMRTQRGGVSFSVVFGVREQIIRRQLERFEHSTALPERTLKKSLGYRGSHQNADRVRARGLPEDRNASRIAAEHLNVSLHPLEYCNLVQQAIVSGRMMRRLARELRMR